MAVLLFILILVGFFIGICAINIFLIRYFSYKEEISYIQDKSYMQNKNPVIIPFAQFKQWYLINPERWVLEDSFVKIAIGKKSAMWGYTSNYEHVYFNYKDYYKYRRFKKQLDKNEISERTTRTNIQILEAVQQDINNLRKQANKEIEHGAKQSIDIQKRLEEDIKLKC